MRNYFTNLRNPKRAVSLAVLSATFTLGSTVTYSQSTANESANEMVEEVLVTGSRITRSDAVSPSPLATVDMSNINNSGRVTIDDYLSRLPQFGPGTGDYSNDSNGGTAGRATLNLRSLGSKRNLVIMDGRRLMSSGTDGAIDINTIPALAIENIEVITGGASVTYGSDALSGVVNFKTRSDFNGFELSVQSSEPDDAGEKSTKIGAAFGTDYAGGKGNLLITAEYTDRGGVRYFERDFFLTNPQASQFTAYGSARLLPRGQLISVNNDGTAFNASSTSTPTASGTTFNGEISDPLTIDSRGTLRTFGQYYNFIQVPLEQTNIFAKTEYEMDGGTVAYGQVLIASSEAFNEGAAPNSLGIWGVTIPSDNYYVNQYPDIAAAARGQDITSYQVRFVQTGGRVYNTENDVTQVLAGLRGQFEDRDLNWDVSLSYGETTTDDVTISGSISFAAVQDIIDTTDPLTGESSLCSGGFNPFGGTSPLSSDCLAFASRAPINKTKLEQTVFEASLEGKLADLPAGEARFSVLGGFRENTYRFNPDADIAQGNLANLASSGFTQGDVGVTELAAEVLLPLVSDGDAVDSVNLGLGYRYSDYDLSGTASAYKLELDAQVNDALMLRASAQHAVRAPNVEEFFRASLLRVQPFLDPCSSRYRGASTDRGAELALCAEQGADPRYTQGGSSAPTFTNGNQALDPEEADTYTFGLVSTFDVGSASVQLTADYYNIEIEKAIETFSAQLIMTKCFNLDGASNPSYDNNYFPCQQINRPDPFSLDPVNQPILNLGGIKTSGYDLTGQINWSVDALAWGGGSGSITLNTLVNILDSYEIQAFSDEGFTDFAGAVSLTEAYPELVAHTTLSVETGPVTVSAVWRHIDEMNDISAVGNPDTPIAGADAYDYFDLILNARVNDSFTLTAGVNNMTDEEPPQIGGEATGSVFSDTNQGVYDAIGRTVFVGLNVSF